MDIKEKAAYLKGLYEGFGLDATKPEGKLINELIALVGEMAEKISILEDEITEVHDYCEELDEDLGDVEEYLCEEDDDFDEDDEDEDDAEEEEFYEVTCPACGETIYFDEDCDPADLTCPACGESFDCSCDGESCEGCSGCGEN